MKNSGKGKGYVGKISNAGIQVVQAPFQTPKNTHGTVKRGDDLRTGKSK